MKSVEMTVRRALLIIAAFDDLVARFGKEADWSALKSAAWKEASGASNYTGRELPELWARYQTGALHEQTLKLAENLNMQALSPKVRKDINAGLNKLRKELDIRRNGPSARTNARQRRRPGVR